MASLDVKPAAQGFRKGVDAYVAGRPDYPPSLLDDLPLAGVETILELGAGTGKFTALLARTGKRIVAVEPIAVMAARIRGTAGDGVEVRAGTAEAIPLADASVELVCCAQAFHWFDYDKAAAEVVRVLKPGGHFALVWNVRDVRTSWVAALSRLFERHAGDTPRHGSGKWKVVLADPRFDFLGTTTRPFAYPMGREAVLDRVLSTSFIAAMTDGEKARIRAEAAAVLDADPSLRGRDEIAFPYVTELHLLRKRV